ncbi:MAG: histidine kinase N-terminal 7TM domain-containing protein [Eubacteriales bacterium]|nr:histidine kinase N-terminal 7TM domain-containing protein [Eubacteriales bacterium]
MVRKKLWFLFPLMIFLLVAATLSVAFEGDGKFSEYCDDCSDDPYLELVRDVLPHEKFRPYSGGIFYQLQHGCVAKAYEMQAVPAVRNKTAQYWYPHVLVTPVIVVDRARVKTTIRGWRDLRLVDDTISFMRGKREDRLLLSAISYGLTKGHYISQEGVELLSHLNEQGHLVADAPDAPVFICMDAQFKSIRERYPKAEMILPQEGTLTFVKGVLSQTPLVFPEDMDRQCREVGYRTLNGRGDRAVYPDVKTYRQRTSRIQDYEEYNRQTERYQPMVRRQIFGTRLYSAADHLEYQMFPILFMILVIIWMGVSYYRVLQLDIRRWILTVGLLILGWVAMRYMRYQIEHDGIVNRYSWYTHNMFQLALPIVLLWIALQLDGGIKRRTEKVVRTILIALYLSFVTLILTNDIHLLVYRLDLSRPNPRSDYGYGPAFYVITFMTLLLLCIAIVILLKKGHHGKRRFGQIATVMLTIMLMAYVITYFQKVPFIRDSDYVMTMSVFILAYMEIMMRSGVVPVNTLYRMMMEHSSLRMQMITDEGEVWLETEGALPLPADVCAKIRAEDYKPLELGDMMIYGRALQGGSVFWQENLTQLNQVRQTLYDNVQRLKEVNALLVREREFNARLMVDEEQRAFLAKLAEEIEVKTKRLFRRIERFPYAEDKVLETARITILLCYIKRRCNLFFLEREEMSFSADNVNIYLDELAEFARYAKVNVLTRCGKSFALPVRQMTLFYDFLYEIIYYCSGFGTTHMVVDFSVDEQGAVMRIMPSAVLDDLNWLPEGLATGIAVEGGELILRQLGDDICSVTMRFKKEADRANFL